jgi:hypothetical protein
MLSVRSRADPDTRPSMNRSDGSSKHNARMQLIIDGDEAIVSGEQHRRDEQPPPELSPAKSPVSAEGLVQQRLIHPPEQKFFSKTWHHQQESPSLTSQSEARAKDEENRRNRYSNQEGGNWGLSRPLLKFSGGSGLV